MNSLCVLLCYLCLLQVLVALLYSHLLTITKLPFSIPLQSPSYTPAQSQQDICLYQLQLQLTVPLTFSPSKKTGHFSLLSLSILISTCFLSSWPSNLMSTSTGEANEKNDAIGQSWCRFESELPSSATALPSLSTSPSPSLTPPMASKSSTNSNSASPASTSAPSSKSEAAPTSTSTTSASKAKAHNVFSNDGSFMDRFKSMKQGAASEKQDGKLKQNQALQR